MTKMVHGAVGVQPRPSWGLVILSGEGMFPGLKRELVAGALE